MLKRLRRAGIKCGIGTDLILHWYRYMPGPYIRELKNFVEAGWSIPEALVAATKTNAEILDMDDRLGTLQAEEGAAGRGGGGRADRNPAAFWRWGFMTPGGFSGVLGGVTSAPQ